MPLVNLAIQHGRTMSEARSNIENAGSVLLATRDRPIPHVVWGADRDRIRIEGAGFWVETRVDNCHVHANGNLVHANGDLPMVAGLLDRGLTDGIEPALPARFPKKLT